MGSRVKRCGQRPALPRCAACGKSVPKAMYRKVLPNGLGMVCERCVAAGAVFKQLGCGHWGVVGTKVTPADRASRSVCAACSGNASLADKLFGWMGTAPRGPGLGAG